MLLKNAVINGDGPPKSGWNGSARLARGRIDVVWWAKRCRFVVQTATYRRWIAEDGLWGQGDCRNDVVW